MNDKKLHSDLKEESAAFFSKGKVAWDKSESAVWEEISVKIESVPKGKKVTLGSMMKYAAAAVVFLAVALGGFIFLYHKTVETLPGEQLTVVLPDGSEVELNAASNLKYYPLKWKFDRTVQFSGEGLFEVEKGEKFEVISDNGTTQVLGTSFNIFARDEKYSVTCLTGKVRVTSNTDESVDLLPNSQVEVKGGKLILTKNIKTENAVDWINNQFFFPGTPLNEVIDEIERRYGVTIKMANELNNRNFAGNFEKMYNVEQVLDFVCKTMQIRFEKQSDNVFLIVEKS